MIDVVCTRWDDKYHPEYVHKLKSMVGRHLSVPHHFICVTPEPLHGIDCEGPTKDWPGTWQVISLFNRPKPFLFVGLSTVIVGSLDEFVNKGEFYAAPAWDRDSLNTNLMWVENAYDVYDFFEISWIFEDSREIKNWGNITAVDRTLLPRYFPEGSMISYRWHLMEKNRAEKEEALAKATIVHCSGSPSPHELRREEWIEKHWR